MLTCASERLFSGKKTEAQRVVPGARGLEGLRSRRLAASARIIYISSLREANDNGPSTMAPKDAVIKRLIVSHQHMSLHTDLWFSKILQYECSPNFSPKRLTVSQKLTNRYILFKTVIKQPTAFFSSQASAVTLA